MSSQSSSSWVPPPSPTADLEADECLQLARDGCTASLGELYERCRRYLLLIANRELDGQLRAKLGPSDIVQETLLKAQGDFHRFEGRTDAELRAWLRVILLNSVRDAGRRFQPGSKRDPRREQRLHALFHEQIAQPASASSPSKQAIHSEQTRDLQVAMSQLPNHYRRVIVLRNLERKSFEEAGADLGLGSDAARKLWLRAIDRLRQLIGARDEST